MSGELEFSANSLTEVSFLPDVNLVPLMVFVWLRLVFLTVPTFYLLLASFIGYFINLPFSFLRLLSTWLQLDLL